MLGSIVAQVIVLDAPKKHALATDLKRGIVVEQPAREVVLLDFIAPCRNSVRNGLQG